MNIRLLAMALLMLVIGHAAHAASTLIKNATVYTISNEQPLENTDVLIENGKIAQVGQSLDVSADETIDARGKVVTPGLFSSDTHLGLVEIDMVASTNDAANLSTLFGPSFSVAPIINPASTLFAWNRRNGLTRAVVAPVNGDDLFAGLGAVVTLNDRGSLSSANAGQYIVYGEQGAHLTSGSRAAAYAKLKLALDEAKFLMSSTESFSRGQTHGFSLPIHDLKALQPVLEGSVPLIAKVHRASDIRTLLRLKSEYGFKLIIRGGAEAWMLAEQLNNAEVPVILDPTQNNPAAFESLGARLDTPKILHEAGVTLLFTGMDFLNTHNAYLVRQVAGNAVAHGLPKAAAMAAITRNPAQVFDVANYGTLETGMDADVVIWTGDPLEVTSWAEQVFIQGQKIPMVSRADRLRDRYMEPTKGNSIFFDQKSE